MKEYVKWIQKTLIILGYDPGAVDGIYGRSTQKAVLAFQKDQQLLEDGIVGAKTNKALLSAIKDKKLFSDDQKDADNLGAGQTLILKNFREDEFKCSCGCGLDVVRELKIFAQEIRDHFGWPLTISSGARCPVVNEAVGGVPDSCHLTGQAFDAYFAGQMNHKMVNEMAEFALSKRIGVIRYPNRLFCHFQTYPRNKVSY